MSAIWFETPDATQNGTFWTTITGSVTYDTTAAKKISGLASWKCDSGAGNAAAFARKNAIMADAGRRVSVCFYLDDLPAVEARILSISNAASYLLYTLRILSTGVLQYFDSSDTFKNGSTLSVDTLYRISMAYVIIAANNFTIKIYVNGALDITVTQADFTLTGIAGVNLHVGWVLSPGANKVLNFSHVYVDDDTSLTDTGDMRVTAKLPAAVNNNLYATLGGTGAVNERPISETNYKADLAKVQLLQDYTLQTIYTGDVNLAAVDQSNSVGTLNWQGGIRGATWWAQTFTPSVNHSIGYVRVNMYKDGSPPGALTVAIRATDVDGKPTGGNLTSGTILASSVPGTSWATATWVAAAVTPYALTAGVKYAIVLYTSGGDISNQYQWCSTGTNPYAGGSLGLSSDSGTTWTLYPAEDFMFAEGANTQATNITIIARDAWMWFKSNDIDAATFQYLVDNGVSTTAFSSNTAYRLGNLITTSATYPSNAAGIGQKSSGTADDSYLAECGTLIAYLVAAVSTTLSVSTTQAATVADSPTAIGPPNPNLVQAATLTEVAPSLDGAQNLSLIDILTVTATPTMSGDLFVSLAQAVAIADTPILGGVPNASLTEAATITEVAPVVDVVAQASLVETVSVADAPMVVAGMEVSHTDAVAVIDVAPTLDGAQNPALVQAVAVAEATPIVSTDLMVLFVDATAVADAPTVQVVVVGDINASTTDATTVGEVIAVDLLLETVVTDVIASAEAPSLSGVANPTLTEAVASAEVLGIVTNLAIGLAEAVVAVDILTLSGIANPALVEATTLSESITASADLLVALAQVAVVADTLTVSGIANPALADALMVAEALGVTADLILSLTDSVTVIDVASPSSVANPALIDVVAIVEALTTEPLLILSTTNAVTVAEALALSDIANPTVTDSIVAAEIVAIGETLEVLLVQAVSTTDSLTVSGIANPALVDALTVVDAPPILGGVPNVGLAGAVTVAESLSATTGDVNVSLIETIPVAESAVVADIANIGLVEAASATEIIGAAVELNLSITDSITAAELISPSDITNPVLAEAVVVAELLSIGGILEATALETVTVVDALILSALANINLADLITVAEVINLEEAIEVDLTEAVSVVEVVDVFAGGILSATVSDAINVNDNLVAALSIESEVIDAAAVAAIIAADMLLTMTAAEIALAQDISYATIFVPIIVYPGRPKEHGIDMPERGAGIIVNPYRGSGVMVVPRTHYRSRPKR